MPFTLSKDFKKHGGKDLEEKSTFDVHIYFSSSVSYGESI
jgi:hypothetical protein